MFLKGTLHVAGHTKAQLNPPDDIWTRYLSRESPLVTSTPLQLNHSHSSFQRDYFPEQAWWACSTGLTPCMNGTILNSSTPDGFYILVQLVLRIIYYSEETVLRVLVGQIEGDLMRQRRKPNSLHLALIPGAGLTGAGTGIAMLALQEKK